MSNDLVKASDAAIPAIKGSGQSLPVLVERAGPAGRLRVGRILLWPNTTTRTRKRRTWRR